MMDARVFAQHPAFAVLDLSARTLRRDSLLAEIGVDEARIVAIGDEADLLAIRLLGHRKTQLARQLAHLRLGHFAQRKLRSRQLLLLQAEKKIGLIFAGVRTLTHLV